MAFPKSRDEMRRRGWQMIGLKTCTGNGCTQELEMWRNPESNAVSPMHADGEFKSHFAICPDAASFRRDRRPEKPPLVKTGNLFQ